MQHAVRYGLNKFQKEQTSFRRKLSCRYRTKLKMEGVVMKKSLVRSGASHGGAQIRLGSDTEALGEAAARASGMY